MFYKNSDICKIIQRAFFNENSLCEKKLQYKYVLSGSNIYVHVLTSGYMYVHVSTHEHAFLQLCLCMHMYMYDNGRFSMQKHKTIYCSQRTPFEEINTILLRIYWMILIIMKMMMNWVSYVCMYECICMYVCMYMPANFQIQPSTAECSPINTSRILPEYYQNNPNILKHR